MKVKAEYQKRTGLQPGETLSPVIYREARMTIPVKEALEAAGARITRCVSRNRVRRSLGRQHARGHCGRPGDGEVGHHPTA
jgi:hypothetical protein